MSVPFITKLFNNRLINVKDYIINNYKKLNLNEIEAMLLIHIFDLSESGEHFLSINQLKEKVTLTFVECSNCVFKLVQKNLIAFNMIIDDNGKRKEMFTLEPLFEKIVQDLFYEKDISVQTNIENEISNLVQFIENELGRSLSSFEIEMISSWIAEEKYDYNLIKLALKEAILANAYNLKYVDRILLNWQQRNINSVEQARDYTKTFKRYEAPKNNVTGCLSNGEKSIIAPIEIKI